MGNTDVSVSAQRRSIRENARVNDYVVVAEYVDEDSKTHSPFQVILSRILSRFTRRR